MQEKFKTFQQFLITFKTLQINSTKNREKHAKHNEQQNRSIKT